MLRLLWWIVSRTFLHPTLFFKSLAIVPMSCEWAERIANAVKSAILRGITFGFRPPFAQRGVPEIVSMNSMSVS